MNTAYVLAKLLFDPIFYRRESPDVPESVDAFEHYLNYGWRENRNPSATFDTKYYLDANPDVGALGICPLVHYASGGAAEGRMPLPLSKTIWLEDFLTMSKAEGPAALPLPDPARLTIDNATSPNERVKHWMRKERVSKRRSADFGAALENSKTSNCAGLILSISHDDYTTIFGGVQNCVSDEEFAFVRSGFLYLHFCPEQPLPKLADNTEGDFLVSVRLNGDPVGVFSATEVAKEISSRRSSFPSCNLVVHHLLGFRPEAVTAIADAIRPDETIVWVHDFFMLCPSYALLRNDVAFCFGPDPSSQACGICCYGEDRAQHQARVRRMLTDLRPTALAPSQSALSFWLARIGYTPKKTQVVPHGYLTSSSEARLRRPGRKLRVGFLGAPFYSKGWFTFEALARRHRVDARYEFYHLGSPQSAIANIRYIPVKVDREHRTAMIDAVVNADLDVAINWSECYETFSFTTYEAVAGGAFVIARRGAGNVFPAASQNGVERGYACDTIDELFQLFENGLISDVIGTKRRWRFEIGSVTATYLLEIHSDV